MKSQQMETTRMKKARMKVMMVEFSRISVSNLVKVPRRREKRIRVRLSQRKKIRLRRRKLRMLEVGTTRALRKK